MNVHSSLSYPLISSQTDIASGCLGLANPAPFDNCFVSVTTAHSPLSPSSPSFLASNPLSSVSVIESLLPSSNAATLLVSELLLALVAGPDDDLNRSRTTVEKTEKHFLVCIHLCTCIYSPSSA